MPHSNKYVIRPFRPQDREAIDDCIRALQEHERNIEPRMKPAAAIIGDYLDDMLDQCERKCGVVLVAAHNDEVMGYACVLAEEANQDPDEVNYTYAYVRDVFVNREDRGLGIGRALLEAAEKYAKDAGATCLRIFVLAENKDAASLYQKFGFSSRVIEMEKSVI